ncbi:glucose-1-phosphate adenylyltransferase [Hahella ganghwensis]|uniref:glucose-1-phosphate adenylyltransferase n=1 Tax=Hahella ganghwensis TaxID=286420 RepID=UPI0003746177|nr:glucose-1-phosphate adenylyltransferase [Hahella ganghwensis]
MTVNPTERLVSRLTKKTLALVLAGGRGSRLKNLTDWRAKPAVPFGGKYRIIDFPLSNCVNSGIRRVGVLTQYKAHSLIRHVQKGWGFLRGEFDEFVELLPAQQRLESNWYLGTANAVYQNIDIIQGHSPDYVLILAQHVKNRADVTVGCIEVPLEQARAFGVMSINADKRVERFVEKPADPETLPDQPGLAMASMGIYVFSTRFLLRILKEDANNRDTEHDFGKDIIPSLIHEHRVFAYPFREAMGKQAYWRDVGTVDAYWATNLELIDVTPDLNLYDKEWPIWTYQEQTPPAKFIFSDSGKRGVAADSMVAGGCIISGAYIKHSLLFSNVRVEADSQVENSVILPEVSIGRYCRIRNAVIDERTVVPDGTVIGENPEEDSKRFYVSDQGVVLVTPEMLGQELHHAR